MKIQLNHPGTQKPFKIGEGYLKIGDKIIREWNNDVHYRKFIHHHGYFLNDTQDFKPKKQELFFWGEWEGNSYFNPFPRADFKKVPNGVHKLFHSTFIRGDQNTDPYIYGDNFKYCICKQNGQLTKLEIDDLVLFGTVLPSLNKFYIDTVFVIKSYDLSSSIQVTDGANYSQIYKESTLEQLNEYLKAPRIDNNCRVYKSKMWWDDNDYFSFVPCKIDYEKNGFERFFIELNNKIFQLSKNPTGISFLKECILSSQELWEEIVYECIKQGFKLGVKFEEPSISLIEY